MRTQVEVAKKGNIKCDKRQFETFKSVSWDQEIDIPQKEIRPTWSLISKSQVSKTFDGCEWVEREGLFFDGGFVG